MQNNTPFSRDLTPDLTRTIRSVVKEGQAYSGVERRAKSGLQQRATKGSSNTEYNHGLGEYRPAGEEDRYYAKQRAEAKAKKTTTVKEERGGSPEDGNTGYGLPRKNSRFYPAKNKRPTGPGTEYHMETLLQAYKAKKAAEAKAKKTTTVKEEQEYTELLETIIVAIAHELNISPQTLIEEFSEQELSEGLRKKIMHGLKVAVTGGALLAGTAGAAHLVAKNPEWTTPRHHSPSSQVQKADSKTTQSTSAAKAKAKAKSSDDDWNGQIIRGVDNSSLFSN